MAGQKNVLVVDDEADAIEYVEAILAELGDFNVIPAYDGEEGLNKALYYNPDLIVLDVMMPKKDGFKVFYDLRKNELTNRVPIVMLTGIADKVGIRFFKKDMKAYLGSEPIDYIEKPLNPEKFKTTVRKVFEMI